MSKMHISIICTGITYIWSRNVKSSVEENVIYDPKLVTIVKLSVIPQTQQANMAKPWIFYFCNLHTFLSLKNQNINKQVSSIPNFFHVSLIGL